MIVGVDCRQDYACDVRLDERVVNKVLFASVVGSSVRRRGESAGGEEKELVSSANAI